MLALLGRLRFGQEGGAVVVMAALWIGFGLVPTIGLVVETGNWYEHKRHLQAQVDAAALAGGDLFGSCFNGSGGSTAMFNEATKYGGVRQGFFNGTGYPSVAYADSAIYNAQIGGDKQGSVNLYYNSQRWPDQNDASDPIDSTVETQEPCSTPSLMFDVKGTESDLPVFASWLPLVGGGGGGNCGLGLLVCHINAHARVQLRAAGTVNPSLPLAVPDINPREVSATFVTDATGVELSGCTGSSHITGTGCSFQLSRGAPSGGLNIWSGSQSVTIPAAPSKIGVRIGVGTAVGSCAAGNPAAGAAYSCYDGANNNGVLMIRGYAVAPPDTPPAGSNLSAPVLEGVWPVSCSGGPFFYRGAGGANCASGVLAEVNYGTGSARPPSSYFITANVGGTDYDLRPVSYDAGRNSWYWSTSQTVPPIPLAPQAGAIPISSMAWEVQDTTKIFNGAACTTDTKKNPNPCKGTFGDAPQQRFYSGIDDLGRTGPIQRLELSGGDPNGPASLTAGTYTLTVTAGIGGNYSVKTPCPSPPGLSGGAYTCFATDRAVLLRLNVNGGGGSFAIDCGGGNQRAQIENGCTNRYSINNSGLCPDTSSPPPTYASCAGVQPGNAVGQVRQGMNNRFAPGGTCLPNTYPTVTPGDRRVVIAMITDFSAFKDVQGNTQVPVVQFGAFYVAGWDGASNSCDNEPYANTGNSGSSGIGNIWGHFIKYVDPTATGGGSPCDPSGLLPCTPVLTQ